MLAIFSTIRCWRALLGCIASIGVITLSAAAPVVVKPQSTDELLTNPGMGWETFNRPGKRDKNLPSWIPSTVNYARWGWGTLEPQPGKLDTAFLDKALKEAHDSGQKLAFRVMCCSVTKNRPYHPAWIKDVGGREIIADWGGVAPLPIPDMDDPVVLDRHLDFIKRLGARYDGHPDLDHLDLGSIGWWGEWHLSRSTKAKLPSLENRMKVVNTYLAAFKKTPLLMLLNGKECTTYATQHGAGWRADSMGDLGSFSKTWNHMRNAYPAWIKETKVQDAWKTGPIAYEPPMEVAEFTEKNWPLRWIFNYALACHGSYFSGKSGKLPEDQHFREELERFLRRLGYRLVLQELQHPAQAKPGAKLDVSMQWQNIGSAPCYQPYRVAYRLANQNGYQKVMVGNVTVNRWLPGSIELFTEEFFKEPKDLPPGQVYAVADTLSLPGDIPPGEYSVSIGVVGVATEEPVVRLGITGRAQDGWYPLSKLQVIR
ncbi:MAG: DUF4832 domain-containing protein [Verrucomicrobiota bacterium]